jgi:hypothetical protein
MKNPARPALGRTGWEMSSNGIEDKEAFRPTTVIAGLDPAIHHLEKCFFSMDARHKAGHDE